MLWIASTISLQTSRIVAVRVLTPGHLMGITGSQTQRVTITILVYYMFVTLIYGTTSIGAINLLKIRKEFFKMFYNLLVKNRRQL